MAHKRTPSQRIEDLAVISRMTLQGYNLYDIHDWILKNRTYKISSGQVFQDIQKARNEWRSRPMPNYDQLRNDELAKLDLLEKAAWEGFRKSQEEEVHKSLTERGIDDDVNPPAKVKTMATTSQAGDARFLQVVERVHTRRCEMLGLDAPKVVVPIGSNQLIPAIPDSHVDKLLAEHYGKPVIDVTAVTTTNGHTTNGKDPEGL